MQKVKLNPLILSVVAWIPALAYAGVIFYLSSLPSPGIPSPIPFFDKLLHLTEYALFGFLLAFAFSFTIKKPELKRVLLFSFLAGLFYGITDEFHQSFVAGRQASFFDLLADSLGVFLGAKYYLDSRKRLT